MNEPAQPRASLATHLRIAAIAAAFGLAAYAVIRVAIAASDRLGWLDWLRAGADG